MIIKIYQKSDDSPEIEKIFRLSFIVGFLFFLLSTCLLLLKFKNLPPQVPLFYSKPWGEERISQKVWLWLIPTLSLFILFFNFVVLPYFLKKEKFLIIICYLVSVVSLFLFFWTLLQIIFLVS